MQTIPPIFYTVIAHCEIVLVEKIEAARGNFQSIAQKLNYKIDCAGTSKICDLGQYRFHFMGAEDVTFCCLTQGNLQQNFAFDFLAKVKEEFFKKFTS